MNKVISHEVRFSEAGPDPVALLMNAWQALEADGFTLSSASLHADYISQPGKPPNYTISVIGKKAAPEG